MQLKDGTPNLLDTTRFYAGEPRRDSEGASLYTDAAVVNAINLKHQELKRRAKAQNMGWGVSITHRDSTADTIWYDMPNVDTSLILVEFEATGKNISSDSTAQPVPLTRGAFTKEWLEYAAGRLTDAEFWLVRESAAGFNQYGIIAPPSVGGTNAIRLTYEIETLFMVVSNDEPKGVPRSHRELICLLAAEALRVSVDMDPTDVLRIVGRLYPEFIEDEGPRFGEDVNYQIPCAGRSTEQPFETVHGFSRRGSS